MDLSGRLLAGTVTLAFMAGCAAPAPPRPMTLPTSDGRVQEVTIGDGFGYVVNLQRLDQSLSGVFLRVTRDSAPELGYADGVAAKRVAEAYCAEFNRGLNPVAYGKFSAPASWLFEGGCI